jgi:Schlafen, AlbA_2
MTPDLFGRPWAEFTLDDVQSFFADAGDEGLTWEAKGTGNIRPLQIRKAACGLANAIGGYLILGASRSKATGQWVVDGIDLGGREPNLWIGQVLRAGLTPVPSHAVRAFDLDAGHLVVVRIEALAGTPCLTLTGEVFVRVSGETVPVHDPAALSRLFERGDAQRGRAERATEHAIQRVLKSEDEIYLSFGLAHATLMIVAVSMLEYPDDLPHRLFSHEGESHVAGLVRFGVTDGADERRAPDVDSAVQQHEIWATTALPEDGDRGWILLARDDGAVCVACAYFPSDGRASMDWAVLRDEIITPAWRLANAVVTHLGGGGGGHARIRHAGEDLSIGWLDDERILRPSTEIAMWTATTEETDRGDLPPHVLHEILRAAGFVTWHGRDPLL